MKLGRLIVVTDRLQSAQAGRELAATIAAVAAAGAPLVLFREKDLAPLARRALAAEVAGVLDGTGTELLVSSDPRLAKEVGAVGVHLAAGDPVPGKPAGEPNGEPSGEPNGEPSGALRFGRSCHSREEVLEAAAEGAGWATLSPIFYTTSKPGYGPALGTEALADHPLPVFALGGVTPSDVEACIADGAYGIAAMGTVMRAPDPAAVVARMLRSLP